MHNLKHIINDVLSAIYINQNKTFAYLYLDDMMYCTNKMRQINHF